MYSCYCLDLYCAVLSFHCYYIAFLYTFCGVFNNKKKHHCMLPPFQTCRKPMHVHTRVLCLGVLTNVARLTIRNLLKKRGKIHELLISRTVPQTYLFLWYITQCLSQDLRLCACIHKHGLANTTTMLHRYVASALNTYLPFGYAPEVLSRLQLRSDSSSVTCLPTPTHCVPRGFKSDRSVGGLWSF